MVRYKIYKCKYCTQWHEQILGAELGVEKLEDLSQTFIPFHTQQKALAFVCGVLKGRKYFP